MAYASLLSPNCTPLGYRQVEPAVLMTNSPNDLAVIKKGSDHASGGETRGVVRVGMRLKKPWWCWVCGVVLR